MPTDYGAFIKRSGRPSDGSLLHLIREDAEAPHAGIPRASLSAGGMFDQKVCAACIASLTKQIDVGGHGPRMAT